MATNDAFLWYTAGDWGPLGLAVPNFGKRTQSQNPTIRYLTSVMGRNLQNVMYHPDSKLSTPPSINTLIRIHKLCTRARSILFNRAVPANTPSMEPAHVLPAPEEFLVYPVPYFTVRNQWLKEYCGLTLLAITEAFQHQENAKPIEISIDFSSLIGQYIHRVYFLMATELFRVPKDLAVKLDFTLTDEQLASYNPADWFTATEMIDTVPDLVNWPTEDDLEILTNGIPVNNLPVLGRWPSSGVAAKTANATPAPVEAFAKPSLV